MCIYIDKWLIIYVNPTQFHLYKFQFVMSTFTKGVSGLSHFQPAININIYIYIYQYKSPNFQWISHGLPRAQADPVPYFTVGPACR